MDFVELLWKRILPLALLAMFAATVFWMMSLTPGRFTQDRLLMIMGASMLAFGLTSRAVSLALSRATNSALPRPPFAVRASTPVIASLSKIFIGFGSAFLMTGMSFYILPPSGKIEWIMWLLFAGVALLVTGGCLLASEGMQTVFWKNDLLLIDEHAITREGPGSFRLLLTEIEDLRFTREILSRSRIPVMTIRASASEAQRLKCLHIGKSTVFESNAGNVNLMLSLNGYAVWPDYLFNAIYERWERARGSSGFP